MPSALPHGAISCRCDAAGRRTSLTRGNGTVTSYGFDNVSRLTSLAQDLSGTSYDVTTTFGYSPASQIATSTRSNDAYFWDRHANGGTANVFNGLNETTSLGGTSITYDARGNPATIGPFTWSYTSENLLVSGNGPATLAYDPLTRLYQSTNGSAVVRYQYDGRAMIADYDGSGTLQKRYVHGPGTDEPLVEYTGSGTSSRSLSSGDRDSPCAKQEMGGRTPVPPPFSSSRPKNNW